MSYKLSRRAFLVGATALTLPAGLAFAREYRGEGMPWRGGVADPPWYGLEQQTFFTPTEREAVDALTSRLIPSDDTGPGAREADVVTFIDRQLAGFYGRGQRWYMQGPFADDPLDTQGYQAAHTPAELWRAALAALDDYCDQNFEGRRFVQLSADEQDGVLQGLDEEEIEFDDAPAKLFFDFAREMTIEGFFCDPVYGGNRDMAGWHLVGFPGARYDYRDYLAHDGAAIDMPPVGLMGRPEWNR